MTQGFERLQRDMQGYMPASILAALAELDVGTTILQNGNSLGLREVAVLCGCDQRGCEVLLDSLVALAYFTKSGVGDEARYSVAEAYRESLDSRHPASYIPMMRHLACKQRAWVRLSRAVREGRPQQAEPSILGEEQDRISFIMGMHAIAARAQQAVMRSLDRAGVLNFSRQDLRILDVGGASGTYTEAFLNRLPGSSATIFDLAVGIEQARQRFSGTGLASRLTLVTGDFTRDSLPRGFDFAWVSAIIHQMDRGASRTLYAKILDALNPGGMIAIRDYVMEPGRTSPVGGALFGINMLVNTAGGRVYTFAEIEEDLLSAGFSAITHAVQTADMCAVVTARKGEDSASGR